MSSTDRDTQSAFDTAAEALAAQAPIPLLRRIIECRETIDRLRARGVAWAQIADLLKSAGIGISPRGLANYASRIRRAVAALEATGETTPDGDRICAVCRAHARPAASASRHPARWSPALRKHDIPTASPGRPAHTQAILTRNPDQEL